MRLQIELLVVAALIGAACGQAPDRPAQDERQPPKVDPGGPGAAPSDAVVLFSGADLSQWTNHQGGMPEGWTIRDGAMVCVARHEHQEPTGTWDLLSRRRFEDAQIHVEYAVPNIPRAKGQARGNSGVYIQGRYEVQVLDSWRNPTYPNGSNAALYGQFPPQVNVSRPPEEWQTYDMIFHPPKCGASGETLAPGRLTMLHNGVLVHDHVPVRPSGRCAGGPGPLLLQDHYHPDVTSTPVRYRNIWVRAIPPESGS